MALTKGGLCLSTEYVNVNSYLTWQCNNGHTWLAILNNIKRGKWCPTCYGNKKLSIESCHALAKTNDGECLSTNYINADTTYTWKCNQNHIWEATYGNIQAGKWCPTCRIKQRNEKLLLSIDDCITVAKVNNGKCLSTVYINAKTNLIWSCNVCQNIWSATYNNVQRGRWCPNCRGSKAEKTVRLTIETLTNKLFPKRRLKFKNKRFELDCYNEDLKLGIEYDGEQHFLPIKPWGGKSALKKTQKYDKFKNVACRALGITLIRIPYTQKNNVHQYLMDALNLREKS